MGISEQDILKYLAALAFPAAALFVSLPGAIKAWIEAIHHRNTLRRAESEYALKISEKIPHPALARRAEELAYSALVGYRTLSHCQRVAILNMRNSDQVIARYGRVSQLLGIDTNRPCVVWKGKRFRCSVYRNVNVYGSYFMYCICCFAAVLLLLVPEWMSISVNLTGRLFSCSYLLCAGILFMIDGIKVSLAAELILLTHPATGEADRTSETVPRPFDIDEHD